MTDEIRVWEEDRVSFITMKCRLCGRINHRVSGGLKIHDIKAIELHIYEMHGIDYGECNKCGQNAVFDILGYSKC